MSVLIYVQDETCLPKRYDAFKVGFGLLLSLSDLEGLSNLRVKLLLRFNEELFYAFGDMSRKVSALKSSLMSGQDLSVVNEESFIKAVYTSFSLAIIVLKAWAFGRSVATCSIERCSFDIRTSTWFTRS